jgi:hypothetical protein
MANMTFIEAARKVVKNNLMEIEQAFNKANELDVAKIKEALMRATLSKKASLTAPAPSSIELGNFNWNSQFELKEFIRNLNNPLNIYNFKLICIKIDAAMYTGWIKKKKNMNMPDYISNSDYSNLWKISVLPNLDNLMNDFYKDIIKPIFKKKESGAKDYNTTIQYRNYLDKFYFLRKKLNVKKYYTKIFTYEKPYQYPKYNKISIKTIKDKLAEGYDVYIRKGNKFKKNSINFDITDLTRKVEHSYGQELTEEMIAKGIKNNHLIAGNYSIYSPENRELVYINLTDIDIENRY